MLPGLLATEPAKVSAPLRLAKATLSVDDPRVTGTSQAKLNAVAQDFDVTIGELLVPGAMGGVPGDVRLRDARFTLAQPRIDDDRSGKLDVQARNIDVSLDDLVAPGPGAPGFGSGALQLRGKLALTEPAIAGADPKEFAVGARAITVGIDQLAAPGSGGAPTKLSLGDVMLASPRVQVTRGAEGIVLPFGSSGAPPPPTVSKESSPPPSPAPAPTKPAIVPPPPPAVPVASAPPPPGIELDVDRFRLTDGKIVVTDRTVKPFYSGGLAPLDVDITKLRWPVLAASQMRVAATSAQKGKIVITGALSPTGGNVQIDARELPLQQFNPYATTYSSYSIRRGRLDLATKASFGKGKYDTNSTVTLHDFDLGSKAGDSLFKESFGIPLSMALALLRDLQGDIKLDIPVEGDEQGMHVGYFTIIAGALRHALVNALASPLKLVGAIFSGDKVQASPAPITFRLGRDELTDDGDKQIDALAKFLADRPGMGVALETTPTPADVRWLREHDLLQELGAPQGVVGFVRNLPKRGVRDRIRDALAAHEEGKKGDLDADDQKTLEEWLDQRPAPTKQRLQELAAARLTRVEGLLKEKHGIDGQRIVRRAPAPPGCGRDAAGAGRLAADGGDRARVGGGPGAPRVDVVIGGRSAQLRHEVERIGGCVLRTPPIRAMPRRRCSWCTEAERSGSSPPRFPSRRRRPQSRGRGRGVMGRPPARRRISPAAGHDRWAFGHCTSSTKRAPRRPTVPSRVRPFARSTPRCGTRLRLRRRARRSGTLHSTPAGHPTRSSSMATRCRTTVRANPTSRSISPVAATSSPRSTFHSASSAHRAVRRPTTSRTSLAICARFWTICSPEMADWRVRSTPSASARAAFPSAGRPSCCSPTIGTSATAASGPSCRSRQPIRARSRGRSTRARACPCWSSRATPTVSRRSRRTGSAWYGVRGGHARSSSCTAVRTSASRDSRVSSARPGTSTVSGATCCSRRPVPTRLSRRFRVDAVRGLRATRAHRPARRRRPPATLDFERQHELTRIVAAAFFDGSLGGDRSARCWLARRLAAENADVTTRRR